MNKICEVTDYFIGETRERELIIKRLSKYISFFHYSHKSLIVLFVTSDSNSVASFSTVIGAPVGIASASFSLAFSMSTGIVKKLLKKHQIKIKGIIKLLCYARSKLNSIESNISEALMYNEIGYEDFTTIINEEKDYRELKESIRMMKTQRSAIYGSKNQNLLEK